MTSALQPTSAEPAHAAGQEEHCDAFISYSHRDRAFATRLHQALLERGKRVWVDEDDIPPASRWAEDLKLAIESSDSAVFVISPG